MLFVSTFTAATGALVLLILAEKLSPLELGLIAGLGATITDFMIFHFIKDGLMGEIEDLYTYYGHSSFTILFILSNLCDGCFRFLAPSLSPLRSRMNLE